MRKASNLPLLTPQGTAAAAALDESWYRIKGAAKGVAEVWLYGDIGAWGITARQFALDLKALGDVSRIDLHVHSPGGDVFEGMAMYNLLKAHPAQVHGFVDGLAASMGSVVLMACDHISIPANAMIMVHKPWGIQGGDADDLRRYAELLDKVEGALVAAYVAKTGRGAEDIEALLRDETWMAGAEAVQAGFADQLTDSAEAFAQLHSHRMQEFTHMPASIKALVAPRGSANNPATPQTPTAPTQPAATAGPTEEQIRAQVVAEEGTRRQAIQAAFSGFTHHAELLNTCLSDMQCTVHQAREKLLAALGAAATPTAAHHGHVGNGNLVGDSVRNSLYSRLGLADTERENTYNHMTLRELARASLVDRGVGVATLHPMAMVGLAFTHDASDFGNILLDAAAKSLLQGWDEAPETFHLWTKKGRLSDFKVAHRVGMGAFRSLRQVRPGAEYKHITVGDRGETISLATYGELFSINRQAIINDDLDQLSNVPYAMGLAARATIGDLVYATLTSNPMLSDKKKLFDAERKNLHTGAGSVMSIEALSAAKTAMALQKTETKEGKARTLNIRPAFVLVPVVLEDKAKQLIRSASVPTANVNAGVDNPIRNFAEVIAEPRLDDDSSKAWYLAARQGSDTLEVAYLDGIDQPYIDQQEGFTVDGIATKVRIDAGVAPLDSRGLSKSSGA